MNNKVMERELKRHQALDVNVIGVKHTTLPGVWELDRFIPDVDYCDAEGENWIRSIGRDHQTGKVYAAVDNRFFMNPAFDCLWLR